MNTPTISIIAAIAKNRAIGHGNKLLWNIPEDMRHFRQITKGHTVIMGRKTYESIGRPLPNRVNIVITRDTLYEANGVFICHSLVEALEYAKQKESDEIFIIGGSQIYEQGIHYADRLYLTVVHGIFDADAFFPEYSEFKKVVSEKSGKDDTYEYDFFVLEKE